MTAQMSKTQLFQYGFLALPLAFAGLPLYIHAPDFYARELGLGLGLMGIILLCIRLFDAIQDPVIGYLSDKYPQKRLFILFVGMACLILGMGALFYGVYSPIPIAVWFALTMIIATTGFSILTINLTMIGGIWRNNPDDRTRISSWREALGLIGLLVASALPIILQSFQLFFWIFALLILIAFASFAQALSKMNLPNKPSGEIISFSFLKILIGQNRLFYLICFLTHIAAAIPAVLVLFFVRDYLNAPELAGLFLALYFLSGAMCMGLWTKLSMRIGKNRAWLCAMIVSVITFAGACFLESSNTILFGIICVLSGIALGGDLSLPPSILADRITVQKSEAEATQFYAALTFLPKIAVAIASGFTFIILDYYGFKAGVENTPQLQEVLLILYAFIPCLIKLMAAAILWHIHSKEGDINEKSNTIERTIPHEHHRIS